MDAPIVSLSPMDAERVAVWLPANEADYIADRMRMGESEELAREKAAATTKEFFPDGRLLASLRIYDIVADGTPVGYLWIGPQTSGDAEDWWVWDVEIIEAFRGRGYARAAMLLAEDAARALGAKTLGLNVFGFNAVARHLYESLGYEPTSIQMRKPLA